ncbi:MAG: septum formation initiator family protein [Clostridia bacterium]|nr:septum formation initiator family protein [Clostridia bacterium]
MDSTEYGYNTSYNRRHSYADWSPNPEKRRARAVRNKKVYMGAEIMRRREHERKNQIKRAEVQRPKEVYTAESLKNRICSLVSGARDNEFINRSVARAEEWLEVDDKALRIEGVKKKIPTRLVAIIVVVATSLILVVSGAVISSKAEMELYAAENELEALRTRQIELERELELKNDLRYIEEIARNELGMIDREHGAVQYIDSERDDKVEIYEKSISTSKISAFLNALEFWGE